MSKKAELLAKIEQKENQLHRAEQESKAWNKGKYKTSSNAEVSKVYVKSLYDEINNLKKDLTLLES